MLARALWGAAYLCIALTTAAAAADTGKRTWDPDLKRWLTEKELGSIEVYLTEEEALKILFPKAQKIHAEELRLNPDQKLQIQDRIGWKFPEESFRAFKAETDGKVDGSAMGAPLSLRAYGLYAVMRREWRAGRCARGRSGQRQSLPLCDERPLSVLVADTTGWWTTMNRCSVPTTTILSDRMVSCR